MKLDEKTSVLLILMILTLQLLSPDEKSNLNIQPPSSNAANFIKYGEIPVDYITGVRNIDVHLHTIQSGQLTVPLSISHLFSGIKVRDIASPVGLGWVLNAGGLINRIVFGNSDDFKIVIQSSSENGIICLFDDNKKFTLRNMSQVPDAGIESQSDRFNFFYPGNFSVFRYRYQVGIPREPILISYQPLKIENIQVSTFPDYNFKITEKDGSEYYYEKLDKTINREDSYNEYQLTKIISQNKQLKV